MKLSKDAFHHRERSLEDAFFHKVDLELNRKLREKMASEAGRKRLGEVTGISDERILQELFDVGVTAETLVALSLVPLVAVAWADRVVDALERDAVLKAAHQSGLSDSSASYQLLSHWLTNKPSENLFSAWKSFAQILSHQLTATQRRQLHGDIYHRTSSVAEAAGGFLGIGSISSAERRVLDEVENALQLQEK